MLVRLCHLHSIVGSHGVGMNLVIASGFFVGAGLYGAAALRAALGEEAFIYYYGEDMWELAAHGMEFVSVPMTLILGTTGLFNSITIVSPAMISALLFFALRLII